MLRRLLLVAWIGSHSETELAQSMGVQYTRDTAPLCERYLSRFGEGRAPAVPLGAGDAKKGLWSRLFG